jgi:membrane protein insertase, YidC/Oxa1 family, C-terminal domain
VVGEIGYLFNIILTYPILNALIVLDHLFGDFGLAIVVLTLIIKLILFPLTLQQLKSTKASQALMPEMTKIKAKYANDQQAQALATQALYKEYGVNPMAGCLPMLIQLPVLYCLYYALRMGLDANTLPALQSLLYPLVRPLITSMPDPSFTWLSWLQFLNPLIHQNWSWTFPLGAADPTHILPIIAGVATFLSLRLTQMFQPTPAPTPAGKQPSALDATQQSMKMMMYVMPVFTVFIGWNIASGLALYWTVSSIFQAVQQYFVTGMGGGTKGASNSLSAKKVEKTESSVSKSTTTPTRSKNTVVEGSLESVPQVRSSSMNGGQVRPASASASNGIGLGDTSSTSASGGSQYNRRARNGSASARRRNRR